MTPSPSSTTVSTSESPWPHRLAMLLAGTTFPLIWVGGLVTTNDAGMAVPDWPGTYGYNLFLYPWQTWIAGPWDLFIEHGHRLLGALAGLFTIAVLLAVYRWDERRWLRQLTAAALVAIIAQGCLGGARVLLDDRQLAMLHGCLGPTFFALCVALCVFTSLVWKAAPQIGETTADARLPRLVAATVGCVFVQLVVGALLRHIPITASPGFFELAVYTHLIFAGLVVVLVGWQAWMVRREPSGRRHLRNPATALVVLTVVQALLGCATWVVNYFWPNWTPDWDWVAGYTAIEAKGWIQTMIVTAHAATGSLVLGTAVHMMLRTFRLVRKPVQATRAAARAVGGLAG